MTGDLPDTFEVLMRQADGIADRLRREADQVSRKLLIEARRKQLAKQQSTLAAERETALAAEVDVSAAWRQLWASLAILPLGAAEMRAWLMEMTAIREKAARLRDDRRHVEVTRAAMTTHQAALRQALCAVGDEPNPADDLKGLIRAAQAMLARQAELTARIRSMEGELLAVEGELAEVVADGEAQAAAMAVWKTEWQRHLDPIGLPADATSPVAALAVIDSLREARGKHQEADVLQKRIQGIDRDAAAFEARVAALVERAAPDLVGETCDRPPKALF
uniref:hypothetical protein n=1 Tax=Desulfosarcina cetonica TaxID=90730 RepID=UPI001C45FD0A